MPGRETRARLKWSPCIDQDEKRFCDRKRHRETWQASPSTNRTKEAWVCGVQILTPFSHLSLSLSQCQLEKNWTYLKPSWRYLVPINHFVLVGRVKSPVWIWLRSQLLLWGPETPSNLSQPLQHLYLQTFPPNDAPASRLKTHNQRNTQTSTYRSRSKNSGREGRICLKI